MKATEIDQKKQWALQSRLYHLAKKKWLRLEKYRKLNPKDPDYKTYRILNRKSGEIIYAARTGGYGLTLEQVEDYLNSQSAPASPAKLHFVESTAESKGPKSHSSVGDGNSPNVPRVGNNISPSQPQPEDVITIAGAKISSQVVGIYCAITAWNETKSKHNDKVVTEREENLLRGYLDAYRIAAGCTQTQHRIYMFAHLLGAAKIL